MTDWVMTRASLACRTRDWLILRLDASDISAVAPVIICFKARGPSSGFIVIIFAAMAWTDLAAASIFSCPIKVNSRWSRVLGLWPAFAIRLVRWPMTCAEAVIISPVFNAKSV